MATESRPAGRERRRPKASAGYVVDASAVAKLFLDEPESMSFRDWWYASLGAGAPFYAPSLMRFEVGNLVVRNLKALDATQRRRAWREALAGVTWDDDAVPAAFEHTSGGLTFYDAAYVALAAARKASLVTFDDEMARVARAEGVKLKRFP